jgi:CRP/FNR family transcriptional regulator
MSGFGSLKGFRTLGPAERERVAAAAREQSAGRGTVLFTEGQPADGVWAVKEGLVHIVKFGRDGKEVVLEVIPPGELFGAVVALQDRPYPASAVAAEPSVVWRLPAALARDLCQKHPALRASIMEQVATRLREAHERLRSVALEPVEQRLARVILTLAAKIGKTTGGTTALAVTRQELADMIGTTVETTIRITSRWQRAGMIRSSRHEIGVLDRQAIERISLGEET